jgi:hypothetical protein
MGDHESDEGVKITRDCKACHAILSQGSGDESEVSVSPEGLDFRHPKYIIGMWKTIACYECHEGVQPLYFPKIE